MNFCYIHEDHFTDPECPKCHADRKMATLGKLVAIKGKLRKQPRYILSDSESLVAGIILGAGGMFFILAILNVLRRI